eukprot:1159874-Pelagomonas_calceolata.AAC.1
MAAQLQARGLQNVGLQRGGSLGRRGLSVQCAASKRPASQRTVITGMGISSVYGNDCDVFYDKWVEMGAKFCRECRAANARCCNTEKMMR